MHLYYMRQNILIENTSFNHSSLKIHNIEHKYGILASQNYIASYIKYAVWKTIEAR